MRLAAIDGEHRAAVEYAMRPGLDEQTRRVADDVVNRYAEERKLVLEETKPFVTQTMRATVFHGVGDIRVEEVPRPHAGPDEALIRVTTTTI